MRVSPAALYEDDISGVKRLAIEQCRVTHAHSEATTSTAMLAVAIHMCLKGKEVAFSPEIFVDRLHREVSTWEEPATKACLEKLEECNLHPNPNMHPNIRDYWRSLHEC